MTRSLVGVRYRSRRDVPVRVWLTFAAPSTGSADAVLPAHEVVDVSTMPAAADWLFARPQRYKQLEPELVPAADRAAPAYGGYSLVIPLALLDEDFDVVGTERGEHPVSDILDHGVRVFSETADSLVRELAHLTPRYRLWAIIDWRHPPGNDDLEDLLRYQITAMRSA